MDSRGPACSSLTRLPWDGIVDARRKVCLMAMRISSIVGLFIFIKVVLRIRARSNGGLPKDCPYSG